MAISAPISPGVFKINKDIRSQAKMEIAFWVAALFIINSKSSIVPIVFGYWAINPKKEPSFSETILFKSPIIIFIFNGSALVLRISIV